ncbi:DUF998 domain-containing protein [Methanobacterium spitsbergense]|uniref:DUF998 domain-containing protein n=1 Tax=Methanobacterium spitsbergense TaxID=2874285 RepID=A0A8T5V1J9_9EURY|nr:DUF998 domain-containing protein [Methanobacterium spitsbergense]MBZ2166923.1 DUF998 domain-containing protein [Methanobacterium spitsbergense]
MKIRIRNYSVSSITGLMAVIVFPVFTFTSLLLYPTPYNPLYSWVSNLGNIYLNPSGAIFFNLGCILSGIIMIPFFAGLYEWKPIKKLSKILLILGMLLGIYASVSLIMVGVFPETHLQQHLLAAAGVFGSLFIIIILLSVALFNHPKFIRLIAYYGIIPIIIDIIFQFISKGNNLLANFQQTIPVPGFEWAAVFTSIAWVGFLAVNMMIKKV